VRTPKYAGYLGRDSAVPPGGGHGILNQEMRIIAERRPAMVKGRTGSTSQTVVVLLGILCLLLGSCNAAVYLRTEPAPSEEIAGNVTLILYGARYSNDIQNVAFLLVEEGPYPFEVYAPDFDYGVKKNTPSREALEEAEKFVRHHYAFMQSQLSRIVGPSGTTIGYELRPLYYPVEFGSSDVLDINYFLEGNKVVARIRLKHDIEKAFSADDEGPFLFRMK